MNKTQSKQYTVMNSDQTDQPCGLKNAKANNGVGNSDA